MKFIEFNKAINSYRIKELSGFVNFVLNCLSALIGNTISLVV